MTVPLLEFKAIHKAYAGVEVLHGVDLDIGVGERIAMVGPSGAGKSTLGRLLAGIHPPRTGSVTVGGVGLTELPLDEATDVGPLINEAAAGAVEASLAALVDGGARLVGGAREGAFIHPAVLLDVQAEAVSDEIFGPVAPLIRVSSGEAAVELTNASPYGLHTAVFTRDVSRAFTLARRIESGGVIINGSTALRAENLPFGGTKDTGGYREGIHDTVADLTTQKTIIVMDAFQ